MKRMQLKGIDMAYVTLHIGLGTFRAVDVEDLTKHKMDSENFIVGAEAVKAVNRALDGKNKVCAIGTTSMRALETAVSANNRLKEREGWTDKFIFPPYEFKICSGLVTNFHQPESTLLMMATAFGGFDLVSNHLTLLSARVHQMLVGQAKGRVSPHTHSGPRNHTNSFRSLDA